MNRISVASLTSALALMGCLVLASTAELPAEDHGTYEAEIEDWHQRRAASLTSETGWLSLIGLFWLTEGDNTFGSAPANAITLLATKSPPHAGTLTLHRDQVRLRVAEGAITRDGEPVTKLDLTADTTGQPTVLDMGDLQFFIIERGGRFGLRVRDRNHPARFSFSGIDRFPTDLSWRLTGRLETFDPPRTVKIPNVLGQISQQPSPGSVSFEIDGATYSIDALPGPDGSLYLIFADQTSGRETYGGGRFLYSEPVVEDGSVVLDFNKAYNPPCAFTDYATCPLPPRQNKLAVRIEAGEKSFGKGH